MRKIFLHQNSTMSNNVSETVFQLDKNVFVIATFVQSLFHQMRWTGIPCWTMSFAIPLFIRSQRQQIWSICFSEISLKTQIRLSKFSCMSEMMSIFIIIFLVNIITVEQISKKSSFRAVEGGYLYSKIILRNT